jgi:putative phosphoesterase
MKLCFFSDIHGNSYALDEFINYCSKLDIDQYVFCGDIFGYYYEQEEIITKLRSIKNLYCIKGNHDQNFLNICLGIEEEKRVVKKYGNSYKDIKGRISTTNKEFIENMKESLTITLEGKRIGVFHGSLTDGLNGRVYPDTEILEEDRNRYKEYDYVILGHTHYRMVKYIGSTMIINPGSIGQPRDRNGFSFAILNIPNGEIIFHEIQWDRSKLVKDIEKNDKGNKKLIDILFRNEEH